MSRYENITAEVLRRADKYLGEKFLVVDYYRIRRRFAYPLPLTEMQPPSTPVAGIALYPWGIWMAWTLEERILSLGWAAQWTGEAKYSEAAAHDLEALAAWPRYGQLNSADLTMAHLSRVLCTARDHWTWLAPRTRQQIDEALRRIVADDLPAHRAHFGDLDLETVLARADAHRVVHNVAFIGALGVALAAHAIGDKAAQEMLDADIGVLTRALLALREKGFSEGANYDGHVLDFLADWIKVLPQDEQEEFLSDARWASFFHESLHLSAPGDVAQIAPLSDVEPQYTLQINAQIKMHILQRTSPPEYSAREWYLQQLNLGRLRVDGLAALQALPENETDVPPAGVFDAHYAITLRSGWTREDVAVAVAASGSPMDHIRADNGSLCIGTAGHWLIQTPGYQQYIPNSEREFTIGKTARNTPLIDGCDASIKAGRVLPTVNKLQVALELGDCYAGELGLKSLTRRVELLQVENQKIVFVEDRIAPHDFADVIYHWHGHADAAWWIENNWAMLHLHGTTLWLTCPQAEINFENVRRLRGSRGQLTLVAPIAPLAAPVVQWLFVFGDKPPDAQKVLQWLKGKSNG